MDCCFEYAREEQQLLETEKILREAKERDMDFSFGCTPLSFEDWESFSRYIIECKEELWQE